MRDDSLLYSGLTSASSRKVTEQKQVKKDKKTRERSVLLPAGDVVLQAITDERNMLGELLLNLVNPDTPDDQVAQHLGAIRLHRSWLTAFEQKVKNVLREPKDGK